MKTYLCILCVWSCQTSENSELMVQASLTHPRKLAKVLFNTIEFIGIIGISFALNLLMYLNFHILNRYTNEQLFENYL